MNKSDKLAEKIKWIDTIYNLAINKIDELHQRKMELIKLYHKSLDEEHLKKIRQALK